MKNPKIIMKDNKTILRLQTKKGQILSARERGSSHTKQC